MYFLKFAEKTRNHLYSYHVSEEKRVSVVATYYQAQRVGAIQMHYEEKGSFYFEPFVGDFV